MWKFFGSARYLKLGFPVEMLQKYIFFLQISHAKDNKTRVPKNKDLYSNQQFIDRLQHYKSSLIYSKIIKDF